MRNYSAMDTFKRNLRMLLADRGWSQSDLADRLNIQQPSISRLLNTDENVSLQRAEEIANAFGLSLSDMLSENLEKILAIPA